MPSPRNFNGLPPPDKVTQPPIWGWLRTLYEVLHEVHTIKIRDDLFDARKNLRRTAKKKNSNFELKWAKSQIKAQKSSKDDFIREIWWPVRESGRSVPYPMYVIGVSVIARCPQGKSWLCSKLPSKNLLIICLSLLCFWSLRFHQNRSRSAFKILNFFPWDFFLSMRMTGALGHDVINGRSKRRWAHSASLF